MLVLYRPYRQKKLTPQTKYIQPCRCWWWRWNCSRRWINRWWDMELWYWNWTWDLLFTLAQFRSLQASWQLCRGFINISRCFEPHLRARPKDKRNSFQYFGMQAHTFSGLTVDLFCRICLHCGWATARTFCRISSLHRHYWTRLPTKFFSHCNPEY